MTEEMNNEIKEEKCKCICCSEEFRKFLIVALGTFVGVFCALSLFAALHKPPMMKPMCPIMRPHCQYGQHFNKGPRNDFQRAKFEKRNFNKEIPVRVEVEHPQK